MLLFHFTISLISIPFLPLKESNSHHLRVFFPQKKTAKRLRQLQGRQSQRGHGRRHLRSCHQSSEAFRRRLRWFRWFRWLRWLGWTRLGWVRRCGEELCGDLEGKDVINNLFIEKRGYGSMGRYIEHKKRSGALNQILPRDCLVPNGELDLGRFVLDCFCISLIDKAVRNPGPQLSGHWCTG